MVPPFWATEEQPQPPFEGSAVAPLLVERGAVPVVEIGRDHATSCRWSGARRSRQLGHHGLPVDAFAAGAVEQVDVERVGAGQRELRLDAQVDGAGRTELLLGLGEAGPQTNAAEASATRRYLFMRSSSGRKRGLRNQRLSVKRDILLGQFCCIWVRSPFVALALHLLRNSLIYIG